jgi:imidazolonepropionase
MPPLLIHSASQLLTVAGNSPKRGPAQSDLGIIANGAVLVEGSRITAVGTTDELLAHAPLDAEQLDARGRVVLPGFVDAHTHALFAGDRVDEFELRLRGATYLEIMHAGGGIMNTVRKTRLATNDELLAQTRARLASAFAYGTTTIEIKTGYGLTTETELRTLDAILTLADEGPLDIVPTFLGAHAIPDEYRKRTDDFVSLVVDEMLPAVRALPSVLRRTSPLFVDVFCDDGAFTIEQSRRILTRGRELGFACKIHADEFANLGATDLAAEQGAVSADHCMVTTRAQMRRMSAANVIAVLLPGTTFGLGQHDFADGRAFVQEGVAVALGSDLNPGTSWCESMPLIIALAARYENLSPAQAIVAATLNAAHASGVGNRVGSIEVNKQADILIADTGDYRDLCYRYGTNPIATVIKRGRPL